MMYVLEAEPPPWCIGSVRDRSSDRSRFEFDRWPILFLQLASKRNNRKQEAYLWPQSYLEEKSKELKNSPKWGLAKLSQLEHADSWKLTSFKKKNLSTEHEQVQKVLWPADLMFQKRIYIVNRNVHLSPTVLFIDWFLHHLLNIKPRTVTQWGEIRKKRKNDFKGLKYTLDPCDHCRVEIFEIRSSQGGENPIWKKVVSRKFSILC